MTSAAQNRPHPSRHFSSFLLAFAVGLFVFPSADVRALLLELPIQNYTNIAFQGHTVGGIIRTDVNGNIYTFSSLNFPSPPATVLSLSPLVPGSRTLVHSGQVVLYEDSVCVFSICGGAKVIGNINVYHFTNSYAFSVDGLVDIDALTATAKPVPKASDLHVQIEVATQVQATGHLNDLPDILKDALLATANAVASEFGVGTIDIQSTITEFDPVTVNATINELPGFKEITINWTDILMLYSDPSVHFNGTTSFNTLSSVLGFFGVSIDDLLEQVFFKEFEDTCPAASPDHCLRIPQEQLTFSVESNDLPTGPGIPEPSTLLLSAAGLTGILVLRKKKRNRTGSGRDG